jgi:hypothetical protein
MNFSKHWIMAGILMSAATAHAATAVSTFDSDTDGWVSFQNNGTPVDWISTGGNPAGHIAVSDFSGGWAYVAAPAKFLAPASYGGVFAFDLKYLNDSPNVLPTIYNVRIGIAGNGLFLITESTLPTPDWTHYAFQLDTSSNLRKFSDLSQNYDAGAPAPSQAEIEGVLANLTGIFIATDYSNGTTDQGQVDRSFIDNVQFGDPVATPEPASLSILGVGVAALLMRKRLK